MMLSALSIVACNNIKKFGEIIPKTNSGGAQITQIAHQKTISLYYKHRADIGHQLHIHYRVTLFYVL
jgi:hypothetical protein